MPEKQWSCGCMEVDGKLVNECKVTEFNPACFRKAQERTVDESKGTLGPGSAKPEVPSGV